MYKYYYCNKIDDNLFNNKISFDKLSHLIKKYELKHLGPIKEYWINNVLIISNKKDIKFFKIFDIEITYENNYLIQEYISKNCISFNFNNIHLEDEYILYENTLKNIKIILKKYKDYITLEFETVNLINIDNFLYYNII